MRRLPQKETQAGEGEQMTKDEKAAQRYRKSLKSSLDHKYAVTDFLAGVRYARRADIAAAKAVIKHQFGGNNYAIDCAIRAIRKRVRS